MYIKIQDKSSHSTAGCHAAVAPSRHPAQPTKHPKETEQTNLISVAATQTTTRHSSSSTSNGSTLKCYHAQLFLSAAHGPKNTQHTKLAISAPRALFHNQNTFFNLAELFFFFVLLYKVSAKKLQSLNACSSNKRQKGCQLKRE